MTELPLPKPEPRGPKPRRPIRRRSTQPRGLSEHRALVKVADKLWSQIVRATSLLCVRCRMRPTREAHHLIGRTKWPTRWLLENGAPVCHFCHATVGEDSEENRALAIRLVGLDRWEQLQITKHCKVKTDPMLAAVLLRIEAKKRGVDV